EDAVAHLHRQVQPAPSALDDVDDAKGVLVVAKPSPESTVERLVERLLTSMAERRVADVVPEPDRLAEILVQPERTRDRAGDRGRLQRVGETRSVVVRGIDEDLGLVLETPERLGVNDAIPVSLERRAQAARLVGVLPAARLVRANRERREEGV